jgi:hypothetical protein
LYAEIAQVYAILLKLAQEHQAFVHLTLNRQRLKSVVRPLALVILQNIVLGLPLLALQILWQLMASVVMITITVLHQAIALQESVLELIHSAQEYVEMVSKPQQNNVMMET